MGIYYIGQVIKRTRESLGMSQETLCEGICSVNTLSRIENGKNVPNRANFKALMERMGRSGARYNPFIHVSDVDVMAQSEQFMRLVQKRHYEELDSILDDIEMKIGMDDNVNRQFVMRGRVLSDYHQGRIDEAGKRQGLIEALLCTLPSFDEDNISKRFYTRSEITIICNIATSYAEEANYDKAMKLLRQIEIYFNNTKLDMEERAVSESLFLIILSQTLGRMGDIEDALRIAERAFKLCMGDCRSGNLSTDLYNMAFDMELLKKDEKACKEKLIQAYYVAKLNNNWRQMEHIRKHWIKMYGDTFNGQDIHRH